jgi:antitoxin MazE
MLTPLRKMGNSSGVIIPKSLLGMIGATQGDAVEMRVEGTSLVITPVERHPRAGWATAARDLAETGDDALLWPDFETSSDADWTW